MKDKVLFANAGIAKFMALLVTLLTMFASCNFVGGKDARNVIDGVTPPLFLIWCHRHSRALWGRHCILGQEIGVTTHRCLKK